MGVVAHARRVGVGYRVVSGLCGQSLVLPVSMCCGLAVAEWDCWVSRHQCCWNASDIDIRSRSGTVQRATCWDSHGHPKAKGGSKQRVRLAPLCRCTPHRSCAPGWPFTPPLRLSAPPPRTASERHCVNTHHGRTHIHRYIYIQVRHLHVHHLHVHHQAHRLVAGVSSMSPGGGHVAAPCQARKPDWGSKPLRHWWHTPQHIPCAASRAGHGAAPQGTMMDFWRRLLLSSATSVSWAT